jgi:hypothetical protein
MMQLVVMLMFLLLFSNFHYEKYARPSSSRGTPRALSVSGVPHSAFRSTSTPQQQQKHQQRQQQQRQEGGGYRPRVVLSFDSSGWLYLYHFGVARYASERLLPRYGKESFAYSGASGGSLVGAALATGVDIKAMADHIISCRDRCRYNPWAMLPILYSLYSLYCRCRYNPWAMLPAAEDALDRYLPSNGNLNRRCVGSLPTVQR